MEPRVAQTLALWGMQGASATLAAQRENHVYRVDHDGHAYALRLHRPGYRTAAELTSELHWCAYLADQGLHVPRPVTDTQGRFLLPIGETHASVLTWLSGTPMGDGTKITGDPEAVARHVGEEMARLHDITDQWQPPKGFTRPDWTCDALIGETPLWGDFRAHPDLAPEDLTLLQEAVTAAREDIDLLAIDTGLIHADLLAENLMVDGDRIGLLDFDDSAIGYRAFELATFLNRYIERPDFDTLRTALCAGYARRRTIGTQELDLALMLRAITYVGWIVPRRNEPGGEARSKRMVARALRQAQSYLNRRPS